jgi:hypothetical protein
LQAFRQSGDPQQKGMEDALSAITDLWRDMAQSEQTENLESLVTQLLVLNPYAALVYQGATTPADLEQFGKTPYANLCPSIIRPGPTSETPVGTT